MTMLRPLSQWPADQRARIKGVFTDIDDTLTDDGRMEAPVLDALFRLPFEPTWLGRLKPFAAFFTRLKSVNHSFSLKTLRSPLTRGGKQNAARNEEIEHRGSLRCVMKPMAFSGVRKNSESADDEVLHRYRNPYGPVLVARLDGV